MLVRSHAVLSLWQSYTDGHIELLDLRTALAEVEVRHSVAAAWKQSGETGRPRPFDPAHPVVVERLRQLTACSDARKTRRSLRRLSNAGVGGDVVISRPGTPLPAMPRNVLDVADRPVPVPRRWLRELARSGTSSLIAVSLALLLRGSFYKRGTVHFGGTCSASWIASAFGLDERTAKAARGELGRRGWVSVAESPVWHRQRYGMTFLLQVPPAAKEDASVPGSPPRESLNVPGRPPPRKNKNLPLRGTGNQYPPAGSRFEPRTHEGPPVITDIRPEDLTQPARTLALHADAVRRGVSTNSPADRLRFFTTALHASRRGEKPCALFGALARRGCWYHGNLEDEDGARAILAKLDGHGGTKSLMSRAEPTQSPATNLVHSSAVVAGVLADLLGRV